MPKLGNPIYVVLSKPYEWGHPDVNRNVVFKGNKVPEDGWVTNAYSYIGEHPENDRSYSPAPYVRLAIFAGEPHNKDGSATKDTGNLRWASDIVSLDKTVSKRERAVPNVPIYKDSYVYHGFWGNRETHYIHEHGIAGTGDYVGTDADVPEEITASRDEYTLPEDMPGHLDKLRGTTYGYHLTAEVTYTANAAPLQGAWTDAAPQNGSGSITPTFAGNMPHPAADAHIDRSSKVRLEVWEADTGQVAYDETFVTTQAEKDAGVFSRSPVTLKPSTRYVTQFTHYDYFGLAAPTSGQNVFTTVVGPAKPDLASPAGKIDAIKGFPYEAVYSHPDGLQAMSWQIQIYEQNGINLLHDSGEIPLDPPAQDGSLLSAANVHPDLAWGTNLNWTARVRDNGGGWSDYQDLQPYKTDSPPDQPTIISPADNKATSERIFEVSLSDPDGDPVSAVQIEIANVATNATLPGFPKQMTVNSLSQTATYVSPEGELTLDTDYRWRARADDGLGPGYGQWAPYELFKYALVPTVDVTAPASLGAATPATIEAPLEQVEITYSDPNASPKNADRVLIEREVTLGVYEPLSDTGMLVPPFEPARTIIPIADNGGVRNGGSYRLKVYARSSAGIVGESDWIYFSAAYAGPPLLAIQATTTDEPSGTITAYFDPTQLDITRFGGIEVSAEAADGTEELHVFDLITDPSVAQSTWHTPASNRQYRIHVRQVEIYDNGEQVPGPSSSATETLTSRYNYLKSTMDPTVYVAFQHDRDALPQPALDTPSSSWLPWGATSPTHWFSDALLSSGKTTMTLYPEEDLQPIRERYDTLIRMARERGTLGPFCLITRLPFPEKRYVAFIGPVVPEPDPKARQLPRFSLTWEETAYVQDVLKRDGYGL